MNKKKEYLVAKIIKDRNFDIPIWLYDYVDESVLWELISLLNINSRLIVIRYASDLNVREFFDTVRYSVKLSKGFIEKLYTKNLLGYILLLSNDRAYKILKKICKNNSGDNSHTVFIDLISKYAVIHDNLIGLGKLAIKYSNVPKRNYIIYHKFSMEKDSKNMDRLLQILEVSKDMELCDVCIEYGIPALYEYGDVVDVYRYLECIRENKWTHSLYIPERCLDGAGEEIADILTSIADGINANALLYLKGLVDKPVFDKISYRVLNNPNSYRTCISNFDDIIKIMGHNSHGFSMLIQKTFIKNGGDVTTMIDDSGTKNEATIIKTGEECNFIISSSSDEELHYLLYNSTDFVKNILTTDSLSHSNMLRILQVIFEYPFNEELWKILNGKTDDYYNDFRFSIVSRLMNYMNIEAVYDKIPAYMMYRTPSIFYITRNISRNNIKYIPVDKIVPHIRSIISREEYIPLNLFCNGKYISLRSIFNDPIIIEKEILNSGKYGYLCDIIDIDHSKLMESVFDSI